MITNYGWIVFWADRHHPVAVVRMQVTVWELLEVNGEMDQLLTGYCKHLETIYKGSTLIWSPETHRHYGSQHTIDIDTAAYNAWAEFFELDATANQELVLCA